jgi:hypothetical protein
MAPPGIKLTNEAVVSFHVSKFSAVIFIRSGPPYTVHVCNNKNLLPIYSAPDPPFGWILCFKENPPVLLITSLGSLQAGPVLPAYGSYYTGVELRPHGIDYLPPGFVNGYQAAIGAVGSHGVKGVGNGDYAA